MNTSTLTIFSDGSTTEHTTAYDDLLELLQEQVEGYVARIGLGDIDLWVDDEGMYDKEANPIGTAVARAFGYRGNLYGPVVVTGGTDESGETTSLDPLIRDFIVALCNGLANNTPLLVQFVAAADRYQTTVIGDFL